MEIKTQETTLSYSYEELQDKLLKLEAERNELNLKLKEATTKLSEISKPSITQAAISEIGKVVDQVVHNFDFEDPGCYDFSFGIDYENRVCLDSLEFNHSNDLVDEIVDRIHEYVNVI